MQQLIKVALAAAAIGTTATLSGGVAEAQSAARQGEDSISHIFTFADKTIKLGERTSMFRELSGVSRNDKGNGMFHNLGLRCFGFIDISEGKASSIGRCLETDGDGDQIFSTFENKSGAGSHTLIGGTGKFKGISGQQAFSGVSIVKGPDGVAAMIIPLKATWKLP